MKYSQLPEDVKKFVDDVCMGNVITFFGNELENKYMVECDTIDELLERFGRFLVQVIIDAKNLQDKLHNLKISRQNKRYKMGG